MTVSNTKYYTIGKGTGYFNPKDAGTGLPKGWADLGNIPNFSFGVDTEKLEHFSSRGGLKAKDLSILSKVSPKFSFTVDEIQPENMGLFLLGDTTKVTQVKQAAVTEEFTLSPGQIAFLANRNAYVNALPYSDGTVLFAAGDTVTGGTSTSTATVLAVSGTVAAGILYLGEVTGTGFTATEDLKKAAATNCKSAGLVTKGAGVVVINKTTKTTVYTGTDYIANGKIGKIVVTEASTIAAATVVEVKYAADVAEYFTIKGYSKADNKGAFRFVSDNPQGTNCDITYWSVDLKPAGDVGMIGDDWMALTFEAEVFKDESGHPDSPFCDIKVFPAV